MEIYRMKEKSLSHREPSGRQFNTDCEGPISKNDNAHELTEYFIPEGDKFFSLISRYDDFLAYIAKKEGYKAGNTLGLILPFLKAYGATNKKIEEYSVKNILLVPGAMETLHYISNKMPSFVISTSYEPYIYALCDRVGFPKEMVYCTTLDIDRYRLSRQEKERVRRFCDEIKTLPMIDESANNKERNDDVLSSKESSLRDKSVKKSIKRLDEIFWDEILDMKCSKMIKETNPIGGEEKAMAILDSLRRTGNEPCDVMYVGDSITDREAFTLVRKEGGLTLSFNGNRYAIEEAEIATISDHTIIISIIAEAFYEGGREGVLEIVKNWGYSAIEQGIKDKLLFKRFLSVYPKNLPIVEWVTDLNRNHLVKESEDFRKGFRGEKVGGLG
ncbi:MAG: hypothetical protein HY999_02170 [Nitrospinae bacterium]|nr:hypothetical protein [Nitrospinota bacterium]